MGNTASHTHEPLERGYARDAYGDIKNTVCLFYLFVYLFAFRLFLVYAFIRRTIHGSGFNKQARFIQFYSKFNHDTHCPRDINFNFIPCLCLTYNLLAFLR